MLSLRQLFAQANAARIEASNRISTTVSNFVANRLERGQRMRGRIKHFFKPADRQAPPEGHPSGGACSGTDEGYQKLQNLAESSVKVGAVYGFGKGADTLIDEPKKLSKAEKEYQKTVNDLSEMKEKADQRALKALGKANEASSDYGRASMDKQLEKVQSIFNLKTVNAISNEIYKDYGLEKAIMKPTFKEAQNELKESRMPNITEEQFNDLKAAQVPIKVLNKARDVYLTNAERYIRNLILKGSAETIIQLDNHTRPGAFLTRLKARVQRQSEPTVTVAGKNLDPVMFRHHILEKNGPLEIQKVVGPTSEKGCPEISQIHIAEIEYWISSKVLLNFEEFADTQPQTTRQSLEEIKAQLSDSSDDDSDKKTSTIDKKKISVNDGSEMLPFSKTVPCLKDERPASSSGGWDKPSVKDQASLHNSETAKLNVTSSTSDDLYPVADASTNLGYVEGGGLNLQQTSSPCGDSDIVSTGFSHVSDLF